MFLLGWTIEKIQLPHSSRIAARVEGKSSLARLGIGVHVTAPTIHAGFGYRSNDPSFEGNPIQLEIWNAGPLKVRLVKGLRICQLIFEEVHGTPSKGYDGKFSIQGPDVPQPP
jgi:dCTP deaminase